jgi:son of sevenless-like protein
MIRDLSYIQIPSTLVVTPTDLVSRDLSPSMKVIGELDSHFATEQVDTPASGRFKLPPSPLTPIPQPPLTTAPLSINKPTPPTPVRSSSTSFIDTGIKNRETGRSRSETASAVLSGRHLRRRPVLVDDRVSLSRLSTLLETNNMTEVEILTSPHMSGSFDPFSRATENMNGQTHVPLANDDDSLNFYNSKLAQSYLPWYLRPSYNSDTLKVDSAGNVKAGTLSALVERLTVDPPGE